MLMWTVVYIRIRLSFIAITVINTQMLQIKLTRKSDIVVCHNPHVRKSVTRDRQCSVKGKWSPATLFDLCCLLIGGPSHCSQCLCSLLESDQVNHILDRVYLVLESSFTFGIRFYAVWGQVGFPWVSYERHVFFFFSFFLLWCFAFFLFDSHSVERQETFKSNCGRCGYAIWLWPLGDQGAPP